MRSSILSQTSEPINTKLGIKDVMDIDMFNACLVQQMELVTKKGRRRYRPLTFSVCSPTR